MHAVGSVIAIEDNKFMVCGYRPTEEGGGVGMGYLLLPWPLGFMSVDSFSLVSSNADFTTVFEGFRNEDAELLDVGLERIREVGHGTTMEELTAAIKDALAELKAELAAPQDEEA